MILDPSLITPFDNSFYTIAIHGIEYSVDFELYEKLMKFESNERLFYVKPKNRSERKYFEKKNIFKFDIWFVMNKEDLDNYYKKI